MKIGFLIAGIIIILIGMFGGIILAVVGFSSTIGSDPASDHIHELSSSGESFYMSNGKYDIWYDGWSITRVELTDPSGSSVSINVDSMSETINGRTKYGTFEIRSAGQYTLTYLGSATVYITDPISVGGGLGMVFGGICGGIFVTLLGVLFLILGLVLKSGSGNRPSGPTKAGVPDQMKKCPSCGKMVSKTETICPDCYSNI